jgi:hypothetical protein
MPSQPRTFVVGPKHMTGPDVDEFQKDINMRFGAWGVNKRLTVDGDYGMQTRQAAREVCHGLGIAPAAMKDGVTPDLRIKFRHPDMRTSAEKDRSKGPTAKQFLAELRKKFKNRGNVKIAAGANAAGRPIQKSVLDFLGRVSVRLDKEIVVTTGTNHNKFTVDGNVSDHFVGMAADLGMAANGGTDDSPVGDHLMTAALIEAGVSPSQAKTHAKAGGLFNEHHNGFRIQCIWRTNLGGNHHNHVHVGLKKV